MKKIALTVNGKPYHLEVRDSELLVETLRERLGLRGTKPSCLEGECGACTVLYNAENVLSCLILTADADGASVVTIEGLSVDGALDPLQQSFVDAGAVQCGFCTPGMVLASRALLVKNPSPTEEEIARGLDGNLCRCTGYAKIIEAVRLAAERTRRE